MLLRKNKPLVHTCLMHPKSVQSKDHRTAKILESCSYFFKVHFNLLISWAPTAFKRYF